MEKGNILNIDSCTSLTSLWPPPVKAKTLLGPFRGLVPSTVVWAGITRAFAQSRVARREGGTAGRGARSKRSCTDTQTSLEGRIRSRSAAAPGGGPPRRCTAALGAGHAPDAPPLSSGRPFKARGSHTTGVPVRTWLGGGADMTSGRSAAVRSDRARVRTGVPSNSGDVSLVRFSP